MPWRVPAACISLQIGRIHKLSPGDSVISSSAIWLKICAYIFSGLAFGLILTIDLVFHSS
jgi:hypothetical protein